MAYNEETIIGDCLQALMAESDPDINVSRIFVIASGCTDQTCSIARILATRDARIVVVEEAERRGKARAIQAFLNRADEPYCVIVGADVQMGKGSLAAMVLPLRDREVGMTGAHPMPTNGRRAMLDRVVHVQWELHHLVALHSPKLGEAIAFRRELVTMDPGSLVDEASLEEEVTKLGRRLVYVPAAIVHNRGPETIRDFLAQRGRIFEGHRRLRATTSYRPSTTRPRLALAAAIALLVDDRRQLLPAVVAAALELSARALTAVGWHSDRKSSGIWAMIKSTKRLRAENERIREHHTGLAHLPLGYRLHLGRRARRRARAFLPYMLRPEDRVEQRANGLVLELKTDAMGAVAVQSRLLSAMPFRGGHDRTSKAGRTPGVNHALVGNVAWLSGALWSANIAAYLVNVVLGRTLGPSGYSAAAAMISLYILLSIPATGLQAVVAREAAAGHPGGAERKVIALALLTTLAVVAAAPTLAEFLHLNLAEVLLIAPVAGLTLALGHRRGLLQGLGRFRRLAGTVAGESWGRLVLCLLLVTSIGAYSVPVAFCVASSLVLLSVVGVRTTGPAAPTMSRQGFTLPSLLTGTIALGLVTVFFNLDVLLARHLLPATAASQYAALSLLVRGQFYLSSAVGAALLSSVARAPHEADRHRLLGWGMLIGLGLSVLVETAFIAAPGPIVRIFFGAAYERTAWILPLMGLGGCALTATNVLVYYLLATRRVHFVAILVVCVALEALLASVSGGVFGIAIAFCSATLLAAVGLALLAGGRSRLHEVVAT